MLNSFNLLRCYQHYACRTFSRRIEYVRGFIQVQLMSFAALYCCRFSNIYAQAAHRRVKIYCKPFSEVERTKVVIALVGLQTQFSGTLGKKIQVFLNCFTQCLSKLRNHFADMKWIFTVQLSVSVNLISTKKMHTRQNISLASHIAKC